MSGSRKLPNWIDGFVTYTAKLPSPVILRQWGAISAIAGVLEQKVWTTSVFGKTFPHLYVILVGPPGVGKSLVTLRVERLWNEIEDQFLGSSSLSKAALVDELHAAERSVTLPEEGPTTFHSLKVASNELGVLLPAYEGEFMNALTDIYDSTPYSESRRSTKHSFKLDHPQLNILAATTPSYLNKFLPEGAWDQGFTSRTMMIYSGEIIITDIFDIVKNDKKLWRHLSADLQIIGNLAGPLGFTEEAIDLFRTWHLGGMEPVPSHPKLRNYCSRRPIHLLKLCIIASIAEDDSLTVSAEHVQQALDWLTQFEFFIPDIFKSMAKGGDAQALEDCWYYCQQAYMKSQKPLRKSLLVRFLMDRVPSHSVEYIINTMLAANLLTETTVNKLGVCYIPQEYKSLY